jgi:hypothetical protein
MIRENNIEAKDRVMVVIFHTDLHEIYFTGSIESFEKLMQDYCKIKVGTTNYDGLISKIQTLTRRRFYGLFKNVDFIFIKASEHSDGIYRNIIRSIG